MTNSSDEDVCLFCNKTLDEHNPPGQHDPILNRYGANSSNRLCDVDNVSSQFFTSSFAFYDSIKPFWERKSTLSAIDNYLKNNKPPKEITPEWLIQFCKYMGYHGT